MRGRLRHIDQETYYDLTALPLPLPQATGALDCEVCVIGGGFLGVTLALELAAGGVDTLLLEAEQIGAGASGRCGGFMLPSVAASFGALARYVGIEGARSINAMGIDGAQSIRAWSAEHGFECELGRGILWAASRPRHMQHLRASYAQRRRHHPELGHEEVGVAESRRLSGSDAYHGGIVDPDSGTVHPLALVHGLAAAAVARGARLHAGSRVLRVDTREGTVGTLTARIRARHVVTCANVFNGDIHPAAKSMLVPATTFMAATRPLSARERERVLPHVRAVLDTQPALDYYRLARDGALLFGGGIATRVHDAATAAARMRARIEAVFPVLRGIDIVRAWTGWVDLTPRAMPVVQQWAGGRVLAIHGLNGHGICMTVGLGRAGAADLLRRLGRKYDVSRSAAFAQLVRLPLTRMPGVRWWRHVAVPAVQWSLRASDRLGLGHGRL
jgi:gamma-glutamylputrescine oxidase